MNISSSSDYSFFNSTTLNYIQMTLIVNLITVLLGVPTNSYVIWLIVNGAGNGLAAEFFNLNLAILELFLYLLCSLIVLSNTFNYRLTVVYFLDGLCVTDCPLFQCLMCVERYLAVVHPVIFLKTKPLRYRVICCVFVWFVGFGSGLVGVSCFLSDNLIVSSYLLLAQFSIFFSIQMFCLVSVLRALKQSGPGERRKERNEENHMKRRAFHIILVTTVAMVFIHTPSIITGIVYILTRQVESVIYNVSFICFILGGFVQPILFLNRIGKLSGSCTS